MTITERAKAILANPTVKTFTAAFAGAVAITIDNAISAPPGKLFDLAHSHPLTFWFAAQLAHNFISKFAPPPAPSKP
jgi:hypothetical protein